MSFEDELNVHLRSAQDSAVHKTREQVDGERLLREVRQLGTDIARTLSERGVRTVPVEVKSAVPSSRIKHFFKGDHSNSMVKATDGWDLGNGLLIDIQGRLWAFGDVITASWHAGELGSGSTSYRGWELVNLDHWEHEFSREDLKLPGVEVSGSGRFVTFHGNYVRKEYATNGEAWLSLKVYSSREAPSVSLREALLKSVAALISGS